MNGQLIMTSDIQTQTKKHNNAGRPTVITEVVMKKLEEALKKGMSDKTACQHAKITQATFITHMQTDPIFFERMTSAKNFLKLLAGQRLTRIIKSGADRDAAGLVRFALERLEPETYGQRSAEVQINQQFNYQPPQWFTPPQNVQQATEIALSVVTSDESSVKDTAHSNAIGVALQ